MSSSIEQQDDYDEILKDIIRGLREKPKTDQKQIFYEKKYFDYLPNEILDSEDVTSEDLTHESVNVDSASGDESYESVSRAKRDANVRNKRQTWYHIPLHHYSVRSNVHFYVPYDLFPEYNNPLPAFDSRSYYPEISQYNPGNPFQNPFGRYHNPGNFYLPPATTTQPPTNTYLPPVNKPVK